MCLIALAWNPDPRHRLVVAANRDELHARPTAPLGRWEDAPIIAGRDLESGGTWMGITTDGRFAAITNFRETTPPPPNAPSRGTIVTSFLESDEMPESWLQSLRERARSFAGFNLFVSSGDELAFLSNRSEHVTRLDPGIYGLSNGPFDSNWPKVRQAVGGMNAALSGSSLEADLFTLLRSESSVPDPDLPDTGVGLEKERFLSPIFIRSQPYGTRSSTVLVVQASGAFTIHEKTWSPEGDLTAQQEVSGFFPSPRK